MKKTIIFMLFLVLGSISYANYCQEDCIRKNILGIDFGLETANDTPQLGITYLRQYHDVGFELGLYAMENSQTYGMKEGLKFLYFPFPDEQTELFISFGIEFLQFKKRNITPMYLWEYIDHKSVYKRISPSISLAVLEKKGLGFYTITEGVIELVHRDLVRNKWKAGLDFLIKMKIGF